MSHIGIKGANRFSYCTLRLGSWLIVYGDADACRTYRTTL